MSSSSQVVESWISSFCNLLGHEYFAEVSEDFIEDDFNLTGLSSQVPMYKEALEMVLDVEPEEDDEEEDEDISDDDDDEDIVEDGAGGRASSYRRSSAGDRKHMRINHDLNAIESSAELLYGLIHQRYITSRQGMTQMQEKYDHGHFGVCPRVYCNSAKVLPVGCTDTPGQDTVKLFCPSCLDVYTPPNSRFHSVDGAFFGTTFASLFLMTFPETQVAPSQTQQQNAQQHAQYLLQNDTSAASPLSPRDATSSSPPSGGFAPPPLPPPTEINGVTSSNFAPGLGVGHIYEPRIYGFRVSERAKTGPRMKWLRMKPDDLRELDEVRLHAAARKAAGGNNALDMVEDDEAEVDEAVDEEMAEDYAGPPEQGTGLTREEQAQVERRKKAPMRRRRRLGSAGSGGASGPANGVNGVG